MARYFGVTLLRTVPAVTLQQWGSACVSLTDMRTFALFASCQHTVVVPGESAGVTHGSERQCSAAGRPGAESVPDGAVRGAALLIPRCCFWQ